MKDSLFAYNRRFSPDALDVARRLEQFSMNGPEESDAVAVAHTLISAARRGDSAVFEHLAEMVKAAQGRGRPVSVKAVVEQLQVFKEVGSFNDGSVVPHMTEMVTYALGVNPSESLVRKAMKQLGWRGKPGPPRKNSSQKRAS